METDYVTAVLMVAALCAVALAWLLAASKGPARRMRWARTWRRRRGR